MAITTKLKVYLKIVRKWCR